MSEAVPAANGTKKYPFLTFNRNTEDHAKLSQLFESAKINLETPLALKNKWVIWEQIVKMNDHGHNVDYKEHTKPLVSFDSVQAFWNLWFNIPQPSELSTTKRISRECSDGSEHFIDAIMVFRDGVQPMWEDPLNKDGGHFDYRFRPADISPLTIDEYWNNIILGLVGSTIPLGNLITGVRLVDKLNSRNPVIRIEVWFQNLGTSNDPTQLMKSIGTCMARKLDGSIGPLPKGDLKWH
ncbi:eukaryotic translation initiation factor 4E type, putative [Theileria equi strain WA]|uniref:Eukaryotic translation initiation factor 4E type, putative n=1 Tax=Theileria equi strain WA TaxID=1537102 RepID=L0AWV1_THEEQ|nr:eukaryotic translation initiation factor 4E type, putative [Theileria equi strain WA]AFZ79733.1 eukaryotic translation initiation factor 4E type, putative [Theileria equi strain WA]|eukprot:XP_004829399.1 eukaryotic translation initiation factor 4E type, putative [Theileria equi strain WA]